VGEAEREKNAEPHPFMSLKEEANSSRNSREGKEVGTGT